MLIQACICSFYFWVVCFCLTLGWMIHLSLKGPSHWTLLPCFVWQDAWLLSPSCSAIKEYLCHSLKLAAWTVSRCGLVGLSWSWCFVFPPPTCAVLAHYAQEYVPGSCMSCARFRFHFHLPVFLCRNQLFRSKVEGRIILLLSSFCSVLKLISTCVITALLNFRDWFSFDGMYRVFDEDIWILLLCS